MRLLKRTPRTPDHGSRLDVSLMLTLILCLICSLGSRPSTAWASDATLQWDVNEDADYYIVYWRTADDAEPINQSEPIDGDTTSFPLYSSGSGTKYYYSVKAFNGFGNSSDFSEEILSAYSPYVSDLKSLDTSDTYAVEIILPQVTIQESGVLIDFSADVSINDVQTIYDDVTWTSSLDGQIGSGADISTTLSVGIHTVMVSVSDGDTEVASATLVLTVLESNASPVVTISSAASGNLDENGHTYTFSGQATDEEDGDLSASIVWLSDLDGGLGMGASLSAVLSAGEHTITARVADSKEQVSETSINVTADTWDAPPVLSIQSSASDTVDDTGGRVYTLKGVATDEEDGDLSSSVSWTSSVSGDLGTGASITPTLSAGTSHTITARVVDSAGQSVEQALTITVPSYNFAPELSISLDPSGEPGESGQAVTLTGSARDTEDGDISAAISWTSSLDGALGSGKSLEVILASGDHTITALVSDSQGKSTEIHQTLTIGAFNQAPELSVQTSGSGQLTAQGLAVTLTGSAQDSEDGDLSDAIVWTSSLDGNLGTGSAISTTLSTGAHTVTASVTDSDGKNAATTVSIVVASYDSTPTVSIDSATAGVSSAQGQVYLITGSAKDTEDGCLNASIAWTSSIDGALGTGASVSATLSSGTHTIMASVSDSQGQTAQSTRSVVVDPYNNEPQVTITGATAGTLTSEGQPYTFTATASDEEDGDLSDAVIWVSSIAGTLGSGSSISRVLAPGDHIIRAQVSDSGGKSQSASKEIIIESFDFKPAIQIVQALAGDQDDTGQTFDLAATAEDEEDGALSDQISWSSSVQGSLGTGPGIHVHLKAGTHTITAHIEDSFGNTVDDSTHVTSVAMDYPPVLSSISISEGTATRDGQLFVFACSASDKEDGDLSSSVTWTSSALGALGAGHSLQALIPLGDHTITARITDSQGQSTETTREFSAAWVNQEPLIRIISIDEGAAGSEGQIFTLKGSAGDEEDGDLSASIVWTSNLSGELGEGAELLVTLPEGSHTITAWISDQDGGESQVSTTVTVASFNTPPVVDIVSVIAKSADEQGQVFEFSGTASDEEDGDLSSAIVWSSDIDGVLGTGADIQALLSNGEHTIRASVKDSQSKEAEQTMVTTASSDTGILIDVSSNSFYYFKIVSVTWSGATADVVIKKNDKVLASGGPEGTKHFWFSGAGRYTVCEADDSECSEVVRVR